MGGQTVLRLFACNTDWDRHLGAHLWKLWASTLATRSGALVLPSRASAPPPAAAAAAAAAAAGAWREASAAAELLVDLSASQASLRLPGRRRRRREDGR